MTDQPIPMRLCCEGCGKLHIDEGEFATKLHHTHSCQHCGLTWRPAVVHTVGVQFLPGFKNDSPVPSAIIGLGHIGPIEVGSSWKRKTDGVVNRVKELGSYVTGEQKIVLDSGESHNERYLRGNYIALGMIQQARIHPEFEIEPDVVIRCVFAGEECRLTIDPGDTLYELCRRLRVRTHRESRPTSDWEIRNSGGDLLAQDTKIQDVPNIRDSERPTLYINLPVGHGG